MHGVQEDLWICLPGGKGPRGKKPTCSPLGLLQAENMPSDRKLREKGPALGSSEELSRPSHPLLGLFLGFLTMLGGRRTSLPMQWCPSGVLAPPWSFGPNLPIQDAHSWAVPPTL